MARLNVNPTRMELKRLKGRLKTATRGYQLLKDKTDEMIRRFTVLIKQNKKLREEVENDISKTLSQFSVARSLLKKADIELAFSMPSVTIDIDCGMNNVMSVLVPNLEMKENNAGNVYPYAMSAVTSEADYSVELATKVVSKLVKLAEVEKSTIMLAEEIEKGKRRVNALEYVMIPDLEETIKYITMKLEENERSSRTRLMKVKSMIEQRK